MEEVKSRPLLLRRDPGLNLHLSLLCEVLYTCRLVLKMFNSNIALVPTENVATVSASATVIEGVSRSRNALLNGDTKNYDWDSGYTCHQLGSGAIVIQLAQPFVIGSMR